MIFTKSKHWELVGIRNSDDDCCSKNPPIYIKMTSFLPFIRQTIIRDKSSELSTVVCTCQCPQGSDQGIAYTNVETINGCIDACKALPTNTCTRSNTYACRGTHCAYSSDYLFGGENNDPGVFTRLNDNQYQVRCSSIVYDQL